MSAEKKTDRAPSIGAIGEVCWDERNDRYKGLLPVTVHSEAELRDLLDTALGTCELEKSSRVSLRCFAGSEMGRLSDLITLSHEARLFCLNLEAAIPFKNGHLLYLGGNLSERMPSADIVMQERRLTEIVSNPLGNREIRFLPEGYQTEIIPPDSLERITGSDIEALFKIYQNAFKSYTVQLDRDPIISMIRNGLTGIVRSPEDKIVSVTFGELAEVNGVTICEISDSATDVRETARGLNIHAKRAVISELVKQKVDIIFAETRADQAAVQIGNFRLGMEIAGFLPNHCLISSDLVDIFDPDSQGLGSLLVYYLPEEARRTYV